MTLILTALCKDGICVCADRRNQVRYKNGLVENKDDFRKIYKFVDIPLILYNHGVNKFNDRFWNEFFSDYEKSGRWLRKNLKQIVDDFKDFIEKDVLSQLERNNREMPLISGIGVAGFVLCGKTVYDGDYSFYELFWLPEFKLSFWGDTRLIISGESCEKYLSNYLDRNKGSNSVWFWGSLNTVEAKKELIKLFNVALAEKKRLSGDDFSDDFDIESI